MAQAPKAHPGKPQTLKSSPARQSPAPLPVDFLGKVPAPAKTLAVVNGLPIKASDVEAYLWDWRGSEALQDLLSYRVIEQAALKAKVSVTPDETDQAVKKQLDDLQKSAPKGRPLEATLKDQGYPKSRIYLRVRSELLLDKIVLKDLQPADYVKVSTMIFHPESPQTPALGAAIRRADDAYAKLQKGTAWDVVLADSGADARGLKSHGMLGWRKFASFPVSVAGDLGKMKVGEISKPAETQNGIQIFRLESRGSEAKGADYEDLKTYFLGANGPAVLNKIRSDAKITRFYP